MTQLDEKILNDVEDLLNNFMVVSPMVLRGSQPDEEALELLQKAGVKMVVNLRHHSKKSPPSSGYSFFRRHSDDDEIDEEEETANKLGLRFVNISLDGVNAPTFADIDKFVALFEDTDNIPMYVHCLHGRERTGFMLAAYRMRIEAWTVEQAYKEMLQQGFDPLRTVLSDALFEWAKRK